MTRPTPHAASDRATGDDGRSVEGHAIHQGDPPVKTWSLNVLPLVATVAALAAVVVYYVDVVAR